MAVDTAAKRFSMIGFGRPFLKLLVPSGTVDRITLIDLYNGIALSDVPEAPTVTSYYTINSRVTPIRSVGRAQNIGVTTK